LRTILFVCGHNAGRSQMAEAFLNALAKERGLDVRGVSAGTTPGRSINPAAAAAMREIGISLDGHRPKAMTQEMVDAADRIVTMGCGVDAAACPSRFLVTEDWGLDDPAGLPPIAVRGIRDEIGRRVETLLARLGNAE
jgi:protein-tyrosine-phosphatase